MEGSTQSKLPTLQHTTTLTRSPQSHDHPELSSDLQILIQCFLIQTGLMPDLVFQARPFIMNSAVKLHASSNTVKSLKPLGHTYLTSDVLPQVFAWMRKDDIAFTRP
jgi:hypothetical protein